MSNKEKFIGEAPMLESPNRKLKFIIPDKAIKNKHLDDSSVDTRVIEDKSVTPEKLSDSVQGYLVIPITNSIDKKYANITSELYSMIESLQVGGIALSNQFGERTDIGITQKTLTKALGKFWQEMGNITGKDYMDFKLTAVPVTTYSEGDVLVNITADCSDAISNFDNIKIYVDGVLIAESSDVEVFTTSYTISKTAVIRAEGVILGKLVTKQVTAIKEIPFFVGAGQVYTDVMNEEYRHEIVGTLEGNFDVTVKNTGDYFFIIIPTSRVSEFRRADMNGLGLQIEIPMSMQIIEDIAIYKSLNSYQAGTYNIDIDINS
jgi:hypothetical protein